MWMANPLDRPMKAFFVEAGDLSDIATLLDAHGNAIGGLPLPSLQT